jgi:hypothetical protein
MNLNLIELPKWPLCSVKGTSVTLEQAMEILVRTQWYFSGTQEHEHLLKIFYTTIPKPEWGSNWWVWPLGPFNNSKIDVIKKRKQYQNEMGILPLEYLTNAQAMSCVLESTGWCDWDGKISQLEYLASKWPSAMQVYEEWVLLAKTFPFLELTCCLFRDDGKIAIVYEVIKGTVSAREPQETELANYPADEADEADEADYNSKESPTDPELWARACKLTANSLIKSL